MKAQPRWNSSFREVLCLTNLSSTAPNGKTETTASLSSQIKYRWYLCVSLTTLSPSPSSHAALRPSRSSCSSRRHARRWSRSWPRSACAPRSRPPPAQAAIDGGFDIVEFTLTTPMFAFGDTGGVLEFYYNMYGADMGELRVETLPVRLT